MLPLLRRIELVVVGEVEEGRLNQVILESPHIEEAELLQVLKSAVVQIESRTANIVRAD